MDREKTGKYLFYILSIISLILVVTGILYLNPKSDSVADVNNYLRLKYLLFFAAFGFFLPLGCIVRELYTMDHYKHIMRIKAIISVVVLVLGSLVMIIVSNAEVAKIVMFVSIGSLIYIIIPSKAKER